MTNKLLAAEIMRNSMDCGTCAQHLEAGHICFQKIKIFAVV